MVDDGAAGVSGAVARWGALAGGGQRGTRGACAPRDGRAARKHRTVTSFSFADHFPMAWLIFATKAWASPSLKEPEICTLPSVISL